MSQEFDDLEKEVAETTDAEQAIIVFLQGIKAQLDAAGTDATKLKVLSTKLDDGQKNIAAAILANTPAATTGTGTETGNTSEETTTGEGTGSAEGGENNAAGNTGEGTGEGTNNS